MKSKKWAWRRGRQYRRWVVARDRMAKHLVQGFRDLMHAPSILRRVFLVEEY